MEKKLYYIIDNGDSSYTMELDDCMELIKDEMLGVSEDQAKKDEPEWTLYPTWLTEEEFENLPEEE